MHFIAIMFRLFLHHPLPTACFFPGGGENDGGGGKNPERGLADAPTAKKANASGWKSP